MQEERLVEITREEYEEYITMKVRKKLAMKRFNANDLYYGREIAETMDIELQEGK